MKDRRLSKSLCSVIVLKELPATIAIITADKVTEIFYTSDDLCIFFDTPMQNILPISDNKHSKTQKSTEKAIFLQNTCKIQKNVIPLHSQFSNNGAIAQMVEQRTENPCVPGSIPGGTTQKRVTHLSDSFFVYIQLVP